jgi:hypothetical protein
MRGIDLIAFPCSAQWRVDQAWLAYRCGGSAGIVEACDQGRSQEQRTGFPFHPIPKDQAPLVARSLAHWSSIL